MSFQTVANVATRAIGRSTLRARKYAPEILTGVGILASVTSTVLAVRATTKLGPVVEDHEKRVTYTRAMSESHMTKRELNQELTREFARTGLELGKLYGPAIGVGLLGYTSIVCGHGIMAKRQAGILAAYATIEKTLAEYRKRVQEVVGPEKEAELYHNVDFETIENEAGKPERVIKTSRGTSQYAVFFDESSSHWSRDPEQNKFYLNMQQNWFNDRLASVGHVFLNEVYDALGVPRTKAGQVVGWVYTNNKDSYIDFGMFRNESPVRQFVNGRESSILLDFNVDGPILDLFSRPSCADDQDEHAGFMSTFRR